MVPENVQTISPKRFLYTVLSASFLLSSVFAGTFYYINDFGLWHPRENIRIWGREKTSKYLLSFRYVPENFEGIMIGPSVSANLDTRKIENYKIYNLSMNGANISELKYAADNVLKHENTEYLILCLYPYITKDSGIKGRQINPKEYWGSIFSFLPLEMLRSKYSARSNPERDGFRESTWGYNDITAGRKIRFEDVVRTREPESEIIIDQNAYDELKSVIDLARENNIQIFAFYYPIFHDWQQNLEATGAWDYYQKEMGDLFDEGDVVWDFNTPEYHYITKDYASYMDGHLSRVGADRVIEIIAEKVNQFESQNQ